MFDRAARLGCHWSVVALTAIAGPGRTDVAVPKPYPEEVRQDVVRAARKRGPDVPMEQIARSFGIHPTTLNSWLRADVDDRARLSMSPDLARENRDLKRYVRLLEMENEVLRRAAAYLAQGSPSGNAPTRW